MDESEISSRATEWVARLDREGGSPAVRDELERWLDEDRRHRGAYLRAEAAWTMLDRAQVLHHPRPAKRPGRFSRRTMLKVGFGAAATAAAAAAGVSGLMLSTPHKDIYKTALGELRRIRLEDGSVMALNSQSEVEVSMRHDARRLKLLRGEAWFQVAHDASRPFTVESGGSQVRAVGTAFSVRLAAEGAHVMVTEGVVELRTRMEPTKPVRLAAGGLAVLAPAGAVEESKVSAAAMDRSLAWREGQIALDGDTLGEAAEAFNRYNVRKLVIDSPELAEAKIVGWFWLDDPDAFARAAAQTLKAQVSLQDQRIIIAAKP